MSFEFNNRKSHCSVLCVTLCWCSSSPENFNVIMEEKVNSNPLWRDFSQKQVSWSWGENKLFDAEQDRREYCLKKNWKYFQTSFCLSVCLVCLLWDIKSITSSSTRQKHDYRSSFTNIQCLNKKYQWFWYSIFCVKVKSFYWSELWMIEMFPSADDSENILCWSCTSQYSVIK